MRSTEETAADRFFKNWHIWTNFLPYPFQLMGPNFRMWGDVILIEVSKVSEDCVSLDGIINIGERRQGFATDCLYQLCYSANAAEVKIIGEINPKPFYRKGANKIQLRRWYRKYGFKVNRHFEMEREPCDLGISSWMQR